MVLKRAAALLSAMALAAPVLGTMGLTAWAYDNKTGYCNTELLNVRSGAGTENSWVGFLELNDQVTITGEKNDKDGGKWYYVEFEDVKGYCASNYITLTSGGSQSTGSTGGTQAVSYTKDGDFEKYMTSQGFPESYKPYLRQLHQSHPNWVFVAQKTGLDWSSVLKEEMVVGRNLVHAGALASWKSMERGAYDFDEEYWYGLDGSWVAASEEIVKYYLDPRNFLTENHIFMFESLSYDPAVQNIQGVRNILAGTFMEGSYTCPDTGEELDYAQTFMDAAAASGVSPYHLASRCRNEQGVYGAPQSLGTVEGWEDLFNFFDVQAFATASMTAAEMGCKYASTTNPTYMLPWTNQYRSIVGGSIFLGNGYITKGQDTLYLQKFDVVDGGNGLYYHQYMTCVFGQANEAVSMRNAYNSAILASAMEFKIPVYNNMPETACVQPTSSGDNNNYLSSLGINGAKLDQGFDKFRQSYTAQVGSDVGEVTISAKALGSQAKVSGTGKVKLGDGKNTVKVVCTAASGVQRTYTIEITKKAGSKPAYVPGDADGDNSLTVIDALMILRHNAGRVILSNEQLTRADFNKNGKVDVVDALELLNKISE